ncbi:tRNA (adenosine(37)-N6)-threonylcarbamoyltransferase complex ATPase subunit type 1 TsaE [Sphaerochaeta sp. PS]|uniref:tRNA (adenosine(37)-N6)-threonylcarbamoyltransferase complex ATPase subunit type 1 TsaE n=1 Tax=Sphaerochaeta sp. PS TaxID=3076336 RepID=UPI0028A57D66|nr:tRNA (adenosine(37)-N6)-threonylcarbamoyltransferase complex ATPase subunit type 1 TsaE [Sphaerochaeta sp. PS]MDT4763325.1 tRNA (adenosine(37)-N6)-threonylcarbamoyltransferase complex ATPase subunit type 1 TsaE [Sphaerochaeta sp. PS]
MLYCSTSAEETAELGFRLGQACSAGTVISLRGSLGAGKTVLAKGIARALGITEAIVSPTFTLMQEYEGRLSLHHMDLYRISGSDEFEMIGGEEMLHGNGVTLIEWSEKIEDMLPDWTIFVDIRIMPDQSREITIEGIEL